jgi:hypothetical protein
MKIFDEYYNNIADIMEAQFKAHGYTGINPADKGELSELFVKKFLEDALSDNYKIFRGGKIINSAGLTSRQLDIVLCSKRTIKIFSDKGIYPTETVKGVFSVTATLDLAKLDSCMIEFNSIPKTNYHFNSNKIFPDNFLIETQRIFENVTPVTIIFAFKGDIEASWIEHIYAWIRQYRPNPSLTPDIIVVNKKGVIYKIWEKKGDNAFNVRYHSLILR